jgi:uncharacterized protein (DUF2249 family)
VSESSKPDADRRLDAREIAGEPFGAIMDELEALQRGERLLLINSFEPEPLYEVLAERGFDVNTSRIDEDEWHIVIEYAK